MDAFFYILSKQNCKLQISQKKFFYKLLKNKIFIQTMHHSYISYRHSYEDLDNFLNITEDNLKKSIGF